jgi:fumarate hydratase, class I
MAHYNYTPLFQKGDDHTEYRLVSKSGVRTIEVEGETFLKVDPAAITELTEAALTDVSHLLRTQHLEKLGGILDDPEASDNDRFVATELLKNATIAAEMVFPSCQDTGTAAIMGMRGDHVLVDGIDEAALSEGVLNTYKQRNLRYSQVAPLSMFEEKNTGNNLPAQLDIFATKGDEYKFLFVAKGGGSANKFSLYQKTKALLKPGSMEEFIQGAIRKLGTAACPPYHLALVIGGLSAEMTMKVTKLASTGYYDHLPTSGDETGRAFRDLELEAQVLEMTRDTGIGAQFGGKYFCHDVRVIRLPRHGASCPVGIGVSCSADRNILGKINSEGLWIEKLDTNPSRFLKSDLTGKKGTAKTIDLNQPMTDILSELSTLKIGDVVLLNGPLVVARDIAHAKLLEVLESTGDLPDYIKDHPVYYAGPAKTPDGHASGSFGPTTAQRMDPYVAPFQAVGGSLVMLAKGNRDKCVAESCKVNGGFYLGSAGGPAARLGRDCITKVEVIDYPELGMEAVHKIEVKNFPAFVIANDKGKDFFNRFL